MKRREKEKQFTPGTELETLHAPGSFFTTTPCGSLMEVIIFHLKPFPQNFLQPALYKIDRAQLNTNSKIFFRRVTAVLTGKNPTHSISFKE